MTLLCITCPTLRPGKPRLPNTPQVCDGCRTRITTDLSSIPDLYAMIELEPGVGGGGQRRAPGFESRPPLSIPSLSLTGRGSVIPATEGGRWPQDQLGIIPPLDQLAWWVEDWIDVRAQREQMPAQNVTTLTLWLTARLDWAFGHHHAVDEFTGHVVVMVGHLRARQGGDRGERVGNCPQRFGDNRCDTPLYVDPYVDEIQCTRCKMTWKRRDGQWMHLRAQQLSAGVQTQEEVA